MDTMAAEISRHVGEKIRMKVGDVDYIGRIESVTDDIVEMMTEGHQLAIRVDAVDAIIVRTGQPW